MGAVVVLGEIWEIALLSAGLPGHPSRPRDMTAGDPLDMPCCRGKRRRHAECASCFEPSFEVAFREVAGWPPRGREFRRMSARVLAGSEASGRLAELGLTIE